MNIPLNIDWQQILLHLLNFVILAGGLYLLLYKPVKTFMEKRQQYYQEQDAKAAKTLADAEKTAAEVRQQLKNADADAAAKLAAAQKSADAAMQRQLSDARAQAEQILADAHAAPSARRTVACHAPAGQRHGRPPEFAPPVPVRRTTAAAQREHDKLLSDAQKELKDLAVTATEKLVLQSDGDAFDQFLDAAERGKSHA